MFDMKSRTATLLGMHVPFLGRSVYFSSTFQTLYHRLTSVSVSVEPWTRAIAYCSSWTEVVPGCEIQDATTMHSQYYQFGILVFHYRYTNIPRGSMLCPEFLPTQM